MMAELKDFRSNIDEKFSNSLEWQQNFGFCNKEMMIPTAESMYNEKV